MSGPGQIAGLVRVEAYNRPVMAPRLCPNCQGAMPLDAACSACARKEQQRIRSRACYLAHRDEVNRRTRARQIALGEKERERAREYARAHAEENRKRNQEWYASRRAQPGWQRSRVLARYGLTVPEFDAMLAAQGSRCAICDTSDPGKTGWQLDHDHDCGKRDRRGHRGILCRRCNTRLGQAGERPELLSERESEYLSRSLTLTDRAGVTATTGTPVPVGRSAVTYRYKYGLSLAAVGQMLAAQGGRCGICGTDTPIHRWHLDHDHRFAGRDPRGHRGILCLKCNQRLGAAEDRPDLLSMPEAAWLRAHAERPARAA